MIRALLVLALAPQDLDPLEFARRLRESAAMGAQAEVAALVEREPHRAAVQGYEFLRSAVMDPPGDDSAVAAARAVALALGDDRAAEALRAAVERSADRAERADRVRFERTFTRAVRAVQAQDWEQALAEARAAAEIARRLEEPYLEAWPLRVESDALRELGSTPESIEARARAARLAGELGLTLQVAPDLNTLGQAEFGASRFGDALEHFRAGLVAARQLDDARLAADLQASCGAVLANLGRYDEASAELDAALLAQREIENRPGEAYALAVRAGLESGCGRYGAAIGLFTDAAAVWEELGDFAALARTRVQLAGVFSEIGETARAEEMLREALAELDPEAHAREIAPACVMLGLTLLDAGRPDDAVGPLDRGLAIYRSAGDAYGLAEARHHRGRAYLALGDLASAEGDLENAAAARAELGDPLRSVLSLTALGEVLERRGRADEAAAKYRAADDLGRGLASLEGTWRARFGLGRLAEAQGEPETALEHYAAALEQVERIRAVIAAPALRLRYLDDKLDLYRRAARIAAGAGDLDAAFRWSESAKARTLLELAAFGPLDALPTDKARRLAQRESDLVLLELAPQPSSAADREDLEERREAARAAHELARTEWELADPRGAALAGVRDAPTLAAVRGALGRDEGLLEFLVEPDRASAFVVRKESAKLVELPTTGAALAALVEELLRPIDALRAGRTDLANLRFDARGARELHRVLIEPLAAEIDDCGVLWIVPGGALRRLPFALLVSEHERRAVQPEELYAHYRGCRFLIEDRAVGTLPTAGLLLERARPAGEGAVVVAAPRPLPPGVAALAATEDEANAVWSRVGGELLLGEDAAEARVKAAAPGAALLHFATHGSLDDRRPVYSRLALGSGEGEDGWLHAYEVASLALGAERVVLSACETVGSPGRGEGYLGLARAFLQAGAGAVVASLWRVDDAATAELMERYQTALDEGVRPVRALRRAQMGLLRHGGRAGIAYVHPFFWAGFLHVGDD